MPPVLRGKMREALAATPDKGARAHSMHYFGAELESINAMVHPLIFELNKTLTTAFNLPGLYDWLNVTNFGNDYRMIKVMKAWAEMVTSQRNDNAAT